MKEHTTQSWVVFFFLFFFSSSSFLFFTFSLFFSIRKYKWVDGWMDGWMDGWIYLCICCVIIAIASITRTSGKIPYWTGLDWTGLDCLFVFAFSERLLLQWIVRYPSLTPTHTHVHIYIYTYICDCTNQDFLGLFGPGRERLPNSYFILFLFYFFFNVRFPPAFLLSPTCLLLVLDRTSNYTPTYLQSLFLGSVERSICNNTHRMGTFFFFFVM